MTTPIKGLFSVMLKSPPLPVKNQPVGYLQSVVNLPLGSPRTNSFSSPSWGFEPGSSAFKAPTLATEPRCLPQRASVSRCLPKRAPFTTFSENQFRFYKDCFDIPNKVWSILTFVQCPESARAFGQNWSHDFVLLVDIDTTVICCNFNNAQLLHKFSGFVIENGTVFKI